MLQEPLIHVVGKSHYTKEGEKRVIVVLSVDSIDISVQKQGIPITARDKYKAHASFVSEKLEVCEADESTDCNYIVDVQFSDKDEKNVFKLLSKFTITQGTLSVDKSCTYFEAQDALFEIFAYMDVDPYEVTYSKDLQN